MDLKEIDILGANIGDHWYYAAKARAMQRFLQGINQDKVLDIGAGSGFFSRYLLRQTEAVEACCVDPSYESDSDLTENGKTLHFRRSINECQAQIVLLMDVLEHVDDDVQLLSYYVTMAKPGTLFLITVPAFKFLWSGHDLFLDHKRRYTLQQAEAVIRQSGLTIKHGAYFFAAVFPIAVLLRLLSNLKGSKVTARSQMTKHHPLINFFFKSLCFLELPFFSYNRLAGLSVFCLAEKR